MDHLSEIDWRMLLRRSGTGAELARAMRHLEGCPACLAQWRSRRSRGAAAHGPVAHGSADVPHAGEGVTRRWIDWRDLLERWQAEEASTEEIPAVKAQVG
jgi:hypothetical protein